MFHEAYSFVLGEEKGYVNDPADSGGATKDGVTQSTYDLYRKHLHLDQMPVKYMTREEREDIYKGIWVDSKASILPEGVDIMHYDCAVNTGNSRAAKILQQTIGVKEDGIIGPITLKRLKELYDDTPQILLLRLYTNRCSFYNTLAEKRPKDQKFLKGWLARAKRVYKEGTRALPRPPKG